MGTLKEFIAERAEQIQNEELQAAAKCQEWATAVDRLVQQIEQWLAQADPDPKVLRTQRRTYQIREEGLGTYQVTGLSIWVGRREIRVEPIARHVAGPLSSTGVIHVHRSYGRVDLTDGLQKFMMFRVEVEPEDRWNIIEQDSFQLQSLNQQSFEEAFKSLLS